VATAVFLQGCDITTKSVACWLKLDDCGGEGGSPPTAKAVPSSELTSILCADAVTRIVECTDLVHKHLDEIQDECKNTVIRRQGATDPKSAKPCEDSKVVGIDLAEENISTFYTKHCEDHVIEWLGEANKTLELIHTNVDKFKETHKEEIEQGLHDGIHRGIEKGEAGTKTVFEIICIHEVEREVHRDGGLVHDHLKEVETSCAGRVDGFKCEKVGVAGISGAVDSVISNHQDHCKDPTTWSLWAIRPAVDNFATLHNEEIMTELHAAIHEAMHAKSSGGLGLEALCSDATRKAVTNLVYEHFNEVQDTCKSATEPKSVKSCEDGKIAGIGAVGDNVSTFYAKRCTDQVTWWLGNSSKTGDLTDCNFPDKRELFDARCVSFELVDTYLSAFAPLHEEKMKKELQDGIHRGIEEGKTGAKTTLEMVCTHAFEKEVERDGGLIQDHLLELEDTCKDEDDKWRKRRCKSDIAANIVNAKKKIISDYISDYMDICKDLSLWSLWAIRPAMDNFTMLQKAEMNTTLHEEMRNAMSATGYFSVGAFLVPLAPVSQAPSLPLGAPGALLVMAAAGLVSTAGAMGLGRLARQRALPLLDHQHQESNDFQEVQGLFPKQ